MAEHADLHQALASVIVAGRDLGQVLTDITEIGHRAIDASEATSLTLIRGEKAFTAAFHGRMALEAEEMQYERGYGPCIDSGRAGEVFVVSDMRTEDRWPDYAAEVSQRGVLSSVSVPMPFQGTTLGALNIYATRPNAFTGDDVALAEQVATRLAVAVANAEAAAQTAEELSNLRIAMQTRAVIEQAKGILMERHKITADVAFTLLTHASQRTNVKLRKVADHLVETGELLTH